MDSKEIRRLTGKWATGGGWPKRLEWVQIDGIRGWKGERFVMKYPIMAIVGENGSGKSTVLQAIASIYRSKPPKRQGRKRQLKRGSFAAFQFPDTPWDRISNASILYQVRQGNSPPLEGSLRKPGTRWRGNTDRPERQVVYIDLSRIQPIASRAGYSKLAKERIKEKTFVSFDKPSLQRLTQIMGREYDVAKMSYTDIDELLPVPVLGYSGNIYSGFHQGAGETILAELLQVEIPPYSIVLIDEVESSLHPRLQRRLIRDLAELARTLDLQIVVTTHSPVILDELPPEARAHIVQTAAGRTIVYGVTPEFAMTKMDDVPQFECDLYVEDERAERMLIEIMVAHSANPDTVLRCRTIKIGAASVGQAFGQAAHENRFPRPSFIFLDGDQGQSVGCMSLPGDDAPERVVFEALRAANWLDVAIRTKRAFSDVSDACSQAMSLPDHHEWIKYAANKLILGADNLWQVMCSEWAITCLPHEEGKKIVEPIEDAINEALTKFPSPPSITVLPGRQEKRIRAKEKSDSPTPTLWDNTGSS